MSRRIMITGRNAIAGSTWQIRGSLCQGATTATTVTATVMPSASSRSVVRCVSGGRARNANATTIANANGSSCRKRRRTSVLCGIIEGLSAALSQLISPR